MIRYRSKTIFLASEFSLRLSDFGYADIITAEAGNLLMGKVMKRNIRYGLWDSARNGFWLRDQPAVDGANRGRLGFKTELEASAELQKVNAMGFSGIKVKRFEANNNEL